MQGETILVLTMKAIRVASLEPDSEVRGQKDAPVVLILGKQFLVPTEQQAG